MTKSMIYFLLDILFAKEKDEQYATQFAGFNRVSQKFFHGITTEAIFPQQFGEIVLREALF